MSYLLPTPNPYPVTDTIEIFNGDSTTGALRFLHDALTDHVINIRLKASLFARELPKLALGRPGAFALEITATMFVLSAIFLDLITRKHFAVAVRCDVDDAEINAEKIPDILWLWRLCFTSDEQVEFATDIAQIGLTSLAFKELPMAVAASVFHLLTPAQCPDVVRSLGRVQAENAVIVGDRTILAEVPLAFSVGLVSINDLTDHTHGHLSSQPETSTDFVIYQPVERDAAKDLLPPRHITGVVGSLIGSLQGFDEEFSLLIGWEQLQFCSELHAYIVVQSTRKVNILKKGGEGAFLCCFQAAVSCADSL